VARFVVNVRFSVVQGEGVGELLEKSTTGLLAGLRLEVNASSRVDFGDGFIVSSGGYYYIAKVYGLKHPHVSIVTNHPGWMVRTIRKTVNVAAGMQLSSNYNFTIQGNTIIIEINLNPRQDKK
jgi:chorismate synthase